MRGIDLVILERIVDVMLRIVPSPRVSSIRKWRRVKHLIISASHLLLLVTLVITSVIGAKEEGRHIAHTSLDCSEDTKRFCFPSLV